MANYNTVITNEGAALLASVIANHGTITFTDLKLSENDYTGQETTMTAGTFDGVFADVVVASSIVDITTIKVSATVHGYNISGDHNLYALGVIGTDGNTTALIAICTTTNPDVLRDNASTYAFNINLTVSSTSNITVVGTTAAALYTTDIVDNLTSTATDKPLSANMGRVLGENVEAIVDVYGAKNFLDNTALSQVINGITFTINSDKSVTATGTASADAELTLAQLQSIYIESNTDYILSGCPTGGAANKWFIEYTNYYNFAYKDTGDEVTVNKFNTTTYPNQRVNIVVKSGVALPVGGVTFKPMLRDARIVDDTFAPYAKTNKQLTENKAERSDLATLNLTGSTNSTGSTINAGTFFYLNGSFCKALTNIAANATFTENTNYEDATVGGELENLAFSAKAIEATQINTTYVSNINAYVYTFGNLIIISGAIQIIAGTIPSATSLVTGLPKAKNTIDFNCIDGNGSCCKVYVVSNGTAIYKDEAQTFGATTWMNVVGIYEKA